MPSYCVEYAASNRSTCKGCKVKIDKNEVRIGTISPGPGDYDITQWRHLACNKVPKGMSDAAELNGYATLQSKDQQSVRDWMAAASVPKAATKKAREEEAEALASLNPKKMKTGDLKKKLKEHGAKVEGSKADMAGALDEVKDRAELEAKYGALSIAELKKLCEANGQLKGGTKGELIDRIVDGNMYGALPRCPECGGGLLKVVYAARYGHGGQGRFSCPGFFDDDTFKRCPYTSTTAQRLPWLDA